MNSNAPGDVGGLLTAVQQQQAHSKIYWRSIFPRGYWAIFSLSLSRLLNDLRQLSSLFINRPEPIMPIISCSPH